MEKETEKKVTSKKTNTNETVPKKTVKKATPAKKTETVKKAPTKTASTKQPVKKTTTSKKKTGTNTAASTKKKTGASTSTSTNSKKKTTKTSTATTKKATTTKPGTVKKKTTTQKKVDTTKQESNKVKQETVEKKKKEFDLEKTQILKPQDIKVHKQNVEEKIKQANMIELPDDDTLEKTFGKTLILDHVDEEKEEEVEIAIADIFHETQKIDLRGIEREKKLENIDFEPFYDTSTKTQDMKWIIPLILFLLSLGFIFFHFITFDHNKVIIKKEQPKLMDTNYVFLGDSITYRYDLEKYFEGMPVVKSGVDGYRTTDLLTRLDEMVYVYNPSKVFLMIGTNDIAVNKSVNEIFDNIKKIAEQIKEHRPYAEIYIESVYPVRSEKEKKRSNKTINELNQKIEDYCNSNKITYIDIHSILKDSNGELKSEYTEDGLHMSEKAYEVITEKLVTYMKK